MTTWPQAISSWGPEEEEAAIACIRDGRLTMGSKVALFEHAFARHVGSRHAVMVNSGSSANLIAVAALRYAGRLPAGSEVIVPAIAWATTYAPLQQYGLKLKVVDVELDTLNVDPTKVRATLNTRVRAIVAVNLLGNPAALAEMRAMADERGIALIEDNCESMGVTIGAKACGTFGDVGTFSFFFSHHLNTVEGGMLVTDDAELADIARCLRAHGWTRDLAPDSPLRKPESDFDRDYDFVLPGYNVRPMEEQATVGLVQLGRLEALAAVRRANADRFDAALPAGWQPQRRALGAVPFALTMVSRHEGMRAGMVDKLRSLGIESRPIAGGCFARQRAAAHYDWQSVGDLRNANWIHDNGLMVGNHGADLSGQIAALPEALA